MDISFGGHHSTPFSSPSGFWLGPMVFLQWCFSYILTLNSQGSLEVLPFQEGSMGDLFLGDLLGPLPTYTSQAATQLCPGCPLSMWVPQWGYFPPSSDKKWVHDKSWMSKHTQVVAPECGMSPYHQNTLCLTASFQRFLPPSCSIPENILLSSQKVGVWVRLEWGFPGGPDKCEDWPTEMKPKQSITHLLLCHLSI